MKSEMDYDPYVRAWHVTIYIDGERMNLPVENQWFLTLEEAVEKQKTDIAKANRDYSFEEVEHPDTSETKKMYQAVKRDWENPLFIDAFARLVSIDIVYKECHPEIMQKIQARAFIH